MTLLRKGLGSNAISKNISKDRVDVAFQWLANSLDPWPASVALSRATSATDASKGFVGRTMEVVCLTPVVFAVVIATLFVSCFVYVLPCPECVSAGPG
jgi:hypothetical protein